MMIETSNFEGVKHPNVTPIPAEESLPRFSDPAIVRTPDDLASSITGLEVVDFENIAEQIAPGKTIFFVGIGGISMCGLAEFAHHEGVSCFGSDPHPNARTTYLETLGIPVVHHHTAESIDRTNPDLIVFSKAVFDDNPERLRAAELGIPCVERSIFLGAVSYTHLDVYKRQVENDDFIAARFDG